MTLAEVRALIAELAAQPLEAQTTAATVKMRQLSELFALEDRLAAQEAAAAGGSALRHHQLIKKGTQN